MNVNTWMAGFIPGQRESFQDRRLSGSTAMKRMLRGRKKKYLHCFQSFK
jgi:hypothetical protein